MATDTQGEYGPRSGAFDGQVPAETAAAWKQGEERLYLAALGDVDLYRRSMTLVGATLDHLRGRGPDPAGLLDAAAQGAGLVAEAAREGAVSTTGIDPRLVADAALALRHRELVAEQECRRRLDAIADARGRGETRVVLEESGEFAGDPFQPYRRLEAEVATGRALLVSATPDEEFRRCVHAVEALRVDLGTGTVRALDDDRVAPAFSADEHARERSAGQAWEVLAGLADPRNVHHSE
jgi:hypothetical protein